MHFDDSLEISIRKQFLELQNCDTDEARMIYEDGIKILSRIKQQIDLGNYSYILDISQGSSILSFKIIDRMFSSGLASKQKIECFKKELKREIMAELQGTENAADESIPQSSIPQSFDDNPEALNINIYSLLLESVKNPQVLFEKIESILDGMPN